MTREDPVVQTVSSVSNLKVVVEPVAGFYPGLLSVQPVIMALDQQVRLANVKKKPAFVYLNGFRIFSNF